MLDRNHEIPHASIGYYGTGLWGVDEVSRVDLNHLIDPIRKFVDPIIDVNPVHIATRYLGYYHEVDTVDIEKIRAALRKTHLEALPAEVECKGITASWWRHPEKERKLLMLNINDPYLWKIHQQLLAITQDFPQFRKVEGLNYSPHLTIATVNAPSVEEIPQEVHDFVGQMRKKLILTFNGAYLWGQDGAKEL